MSSFDTVIVGGGAAGLAAALMLRQRCPHRRIAIAEKAPRVGRKLLATGNGTCNFSNMAASPDRYHGGDPAFVEQALLQFPPQAALAFFEEIGVVAAVRENGRVYPLCEQAGAVLDCLRLALAKAEVSVLTDCPVTAIKKTETGFLLETPSDTLSAATVILATGGAASPSLGGSTDGYALAASFGHPRTPLSPAIVQVRTDTALIRAMKGLRTDAAVTLLQNNRALATRTGEVLFTEYGLSGPAVMDLSRAVGEWERRPNGELLISLDLLPTLSAEETRRQIDRRVPLARTGEDFLTGLLHKRIGQTVWRAAGLSLTLRGDTLTAAQRAALAKQCKAFTVAVTGTKGLSDAQVTAGGVCTDGICPHTMMSRSVPGLYLIGEVLDVDGDCGGFNLQWAWSSAYAAATAIAEAAV